MQVSSSSLYPKGHLEAALKARLSRREEISGF